MTYSTSDIEGTAIVVTTDDDMFASEQHVDPAAVDEESQDAADDTAEADTLVDADNESDSDGGEADAPVDTGKLASAMNAAIQVRLTPDNMVLDLYMSNLVKSAPLELRIATVKRKCAEMLIATMPDDVTLKHLLAKPKFKVWQILMTATPVTAPVNGSVEVLIAAVPPPMRDRFRAGVPVREGQPLVKIHPEIPGVDGVDMRGKVVPTQPARPPIVPQGENTLVWDDDNGAQLVAGCDGSATFQHLHFSVQPMKVLSAAELRQIDSSVIDRAVFVTESIPSGTVLKAQGDILIDGDAEESILESVGGSVTVLGIVTGHHKKHAQLRAAVDIAVASAFYTDFDAEGNIYIQTQVRSSTLTARGHLILLTRLRAALYDVDAQIDGAIIPVDNPASPADVIPGEQGDYSIANTIKADLGVIEGAFVAFRPIEIVLLSVTGAEVVINDPGFSANKVVYLKFTLPGYSPIQILGRVQAKTAAGTLVVLFRQINHQDEASVKSYCLAQLRQRQMMGLPLHGPIGQQDAPEEDSNSSEVVEAS